MVRARRLLYPASIRAQAAQPVEVIALELSARQLLESLCGQWQRTGRFRVGSLFHLELAEFGRSRPARPLIVMVDDHKDALDWGIAVTETAARARWSVLPRVGVVPMAGQWPATVTPGHAAARTRFRDGNNLPVLGDQGFRQGQALSALRERMGRRLEAVVSEMVGWGEW